MVWQVFLPKLPVHVEIRWKETRSHSCLHPNPKCLPLLLLYQTNSIVFAGWMDGFCGHFVICKVLHPSSYLIFQKALEHKGKLISSSAFNRGWYAAHTQAAVGSFLLRIIMGSHSLLGAQLNSAHCCRPRHASLLKSQESVLLLSFISYKIHQIVKNSVIIRPKKRKKLMLNHSTWNNCYIPILSFSHFLLVSIVYGVEYSFSSTKRIHLLENRKTVRVVAPGPPCEPGGFTAHSSPWMASTTSFPCGPWRAFSQSEVSWCCSLTPGPLDFPAHPANVA